MAEKEHQIETFQLDYACDACGEGEMRPTGVLLMSDPPQFPHRCNRCDHPQTFLVKYPAIAYRRKD